MQRPPSPPVPGGLHLLDATMFRTPGASSGVQRVLAAKREGLLARGWRHTVLAPGARGDGEIDCGGIPIPASGGYRFVLRRRHAARLIEQAAPDIVEAADPYVLGWAVLDASQRLKVPAVAFCHSDLPRWMARLAGGAHGQDGLRGRHAERHAAAYLARLYERYDLVLAPSRAMTKRLHELGVPQAQHQPLGVDCTRFTPAANSPRWRHELLARLGFPATTRLFVYAGRFAPEKNLDLLAEAVDRLGPGHVLVVMGDGPRVPRGERLRCLPSSRDTRRVARLLASADAFVHAGDQETFGLSALEAMACGTPVVVHAAGGLGELAHGVGLTVPSRRVDVWTEALRAAVGDGARPLASAGLARARAHDWDVVVEQLAARYRLVMRDHRRAQAPGALLAPPQLS
ncbi:glycosyltransferase [Rubrivivax gelatinosus]|uniref:Alpha-1,6-mannosyltransferase n=1 Tax=Rubrivivax gelatinosus TaxID=28068 RepID=A0A4R2MAH9_RUBGE|nr:glycosyltransferase [Rubrivivax gelatinosus]MBK1686425.1 hypothetical protein [Rubrivivax gelatinosus]TCP04349.1 alpha-1,6-mannosyltransferase [Rubrivivax gelatinosus]